MYFVLLKRHHKIISSPSAVKHEAEMGNPTIGHLLFLVEAFKVCNDNIFNIHTSLHFLICLHSFTVFKARVLVV